MALRRESASSEDDDMQKLAAALDERRHSRGIPTYLQNSTQWDPIVERAAHSGIVAAVTNVRVGKSDWCSCRNCFQMPTELESICCREIPQITPLLANEKTCICEVYYLRDDLVSRQHIQALHRIASSYPNVNLPRLEELQESDYRKLAYRAFTMWVHGHLGKNIRCPIPSCAVRRIREYFPAPDETYLGFILAEQDPNAADMID